ncbi:MAG: tetratricopeptide repeat protein [Bacteroidota bacterium]|nr:tetratricopeptide repeat protein [Bacteroidota bacterium]
MVQSNFHTFSRTKTSALVLMLCTILLYSKTHSYQLYNTQADSSAAHSFFVHAIDFQKRAQYDSAIVFFDTAGTIYATLNKIDDQVRCITKKAECLQSKGNYAKAIASLQIDKATEQKLLKEAPLIAAQRLMMFGSLYREQGKYDTALVVAHNALDILQNNPSLSVDLEWDMYTLFAGIFFSVGEYDSSLAYNHRALKLFPAAQGEQQLKISASYNGIAGTYETRGDYQKALDYFSRSLEIRKLVLGEKHPDIANLYNNVAAIYFRSGDYDLALEYYLKSLSIMNETLPIDHPSFGIRYNNIAMAYRGKKEFDKALEFGSQSKFIFVKKLGDKHPNVAGVVNNIGRTYSDMKQYDRALESYQQALSIWKEKFGEKHVNVTQSFFNIGEAYGNLKEYEKAKMWLEKSLLIRREMLGENNVKVAQSYNALGSVYTDWNKLDSALQFYQKAIYTLVESPKDSNLYDIPITIKSISDFDLLVSLSGKAKVLFMQGIIQKNISDLRTSLNTYEHALELVDNIRRGFGTEGSKMQLSQMSFDIYEQTISVALKLFEFTKDDLYTSKAFSVAERSKANILLDAVSELNAKQFAGIPDSLLEQESALKIDLTFKETQLQKEKDKKEKASKTKSEQLENTLFDLKRQYERLIVKFEKEYPDYYSLKHQSENVSVRDIQEHLPDNKTAILEYVVGDSTVTIFLVTKNRCIVKSQRSTSLTSLVKQFRRSIQNVESEEYVNLSYRLYTQLLAPVQTSLKGIQKLYIIPDGILNYLPFEALITKSHSKTAPVNFAAIPYLIKQYEISYQVSARFFHDEQRKKQIDENYSFIGMAPVFSDRPSHSKNIYTTSVDRITRSRTVDGEQFVELKESENEVKIIFNLFNVRKKSAKVFLHNEAKESNLKSNDIQQYRFIHIATHGIINEEKPNLSGIIFSAPENNSSEDGVLYSGEIYNLRLNADLVVLSACETGLGTIVKGEGILGFTRGFMYSGAQNLLVSLWQVADKSTAELMVQFYQNIFKKQSYPTALRNAKLEMIKQGKYAHPVEWSPFVLTGK